MVPRILVTRLFASFTNCRSTQFQWGSLLQHKHDASLFMFNTFTSGGDSHKGDTFTVSYLSNSCGLSLELARKLSKRVNLKTPDGPNAVLDTLKNYGFSKTQVAKVVEKNPRLLAASAEKTLLPKLKFFNSIGVSNSIIHRIALEDPVILQRSLEKCLVPRYEIIRSIVRDDRKVVSVLRNVPLGFTNCDLKKCLVPNIEILRQSGVPQGSISLMMVNATSSAMVKHSRFVEVVERIKKLGFDPKKTTFVMAIDVLLAISKGGWESRIQMYERWGWNCELALQAFLKFPNFMKLSEETVNKKMTFLVKDMGLSSLDIAAYPPVLAYSLEKRIIPRLSVIKILKSKGLLKSNLSFGSYMGSTEEIFLKKFVIGFQEHLPLLPDVYKGLIHHDDVM
ncbi:transcription termination factor MTERF2, chloroplastic-like isoform X1 [Vigna unguiculata]|uniref:transcription termination factor MTERF2, chloroplastic-like isoform X1 n=1 Tax=Vigna unguiculata TaxID=3917 RepID=UPI0010166CB0|nr:transcription termination factor MTERF2, chloroplastic-like isoform X1 [Vigna unguiculata]